MPAHRPPPGLCARVLRLLPAGGRGVAATLVFLGAIRSPGQSPAAIAAEGAVITNAAAFWSLSNEDKLKPQHIRFDLLVYYYDPNWQLIWGECDSRGSFLPVRGEPLPIKAGQRVRIEGVVQPARGILRSEVRVTVLAENALPPPLSTRGCLTDADRFDAQWVSLEGYVCQQREVDPTHIEYQVLSEGRLVTVRVLVDGGAAVPQIASLRARFNGVYIATRDASQKIEHIDFWVPRSADITVLGGLAKDPHFQLPRLPLDRLESAGLDEWVRVEGVVHEFHAGRSLMIRDDTGQLTVATPQPGNLAAGDRVEMIGRVAGTGLGRTLVEPCFRQLSAPAGETGPAGGPAPRVNLRVIQQVMELPLSEVMRGYLVTLRGVVTWADPRTDFFYLQDATGGVCVRLGAAAAPPAVNQTVVLRGQTIPGRYAPEVRLQELAGTGMASPPAPRSITLEQAMTGAAEARRVEIRGYLHQVIQEAKWTRLDLTTSAGEVSAYVPPDPTLAELAGAMVRIAGVCEAQANHLRQLTGIRLWVAGRDAITVEEPPPADPFAAPRYTIAGLNQFANGGTLNRRVTVTGGVLYQVPGRTLLLQDQDAGLMVFPADTQIFSPGTAVEVSGFPGREGGRTVIRVGLTRATAAGGTPPRPVLGTGLATVHPQWDARLVILRGVLSQAIVQPTRARLTLQADGTFFDALLDSPAGWAAPAAGSRLELTGVYLLEFDEYHRPRGFRVQLRTPDDVRVLATPSWWTPGRALGMAGGMGLCLLVGFGWVAALRRRVRLQTAQLRQHMEKEVRMQAELERSSRLDSLGVLAGGIAHDFNNLLTAIMGNLGLMRLEEAAMPLVGPLVDNAERATKRASEVTQQLLTFARGGDPVRTAVDLPGIVREAADFVQHGSNVKLEFESAPDLPPANADAGQISRVVHNLVLNAVQAMPGGGAVRMRLRARILQAGELPPLVAGRYLELTLADTGPGIAADKLPRIFEPYFSTKTNGSGLGLATAHSILKKHQGHLTVESTVGRGTTFRLWLPAADARAGGNAAPVSAPPPGAGARILFMDDEAAVGQVAAAMLRRGGHQPTVVADGAAAISAFNQARAAGRPFDLVILDLTVPGGMGGREVVAELRRIDPAVPVIASSGYSQDPVMARFQDFGFTAVLPKPYDPDALARVVNRVRRG